MQIQAEPQAAEATAKEVVQYNHAPIWPGNWREIGVQSELASATSPLPLIWGYGGPGSGKTTAYMTLDAVFPDPSKPLDQQEPTRTLVFDLEGSSTTLRQLFPVNAIDLREYAQRYANAKGRSEYTLADLFEVFRKLVLGTTPGKYTVLAVDPASDLHAAGAEWVVANAEMFGRTTEYYMNSKWGQKNKWGDAAQYWKKMALILAARFQTTFFTSHLADDYKNDVKTGKKTHRGTDFTEVASLVLEFRRDDHRGTETGTPGGYYAIVRKQRLSRAIWFDEDGKRLRFPRVIEMLPPKLFGKPGEMYGEIISRFMQEALVSHADYQLVTDPDAVTLSDQERLVLEAEADRAATEKAEKQLEIARINARDAVLKRLITEGHFTTPLELLKAVQTLNLQFTLENEAEFVDRLTTYAQEKKAAANEPEIADLLDSDDLAQLVAEDTEGEISEDAEDAD